MAFGGRGHGVAAHGALGQRGEEERQQQHYGQGEVHRRHVLGAVFVRHHKRQRGDLRVVVLRPGLVGHGQRGHQRPRRHW